MHLLVHVPNDEYAQIVSDVKWLCLTINFAWSLRIYKN